MGLRVTIRADASLDIGTGHVMRCLTLAQAIQDAGGEVHFLCRDLPGQLAALVQSRGFSVALLPQPAGREDLGANALPHGHWLGVAQERDAAETLAVLAAWQAGGKAGTMIDWLIVDHYGIDARWETAVRACCNKLMVVDDLADRAHSCDLLLDQNLGRTAGDYQSLVPAACRLLLGPHYALLRPEFAAARAASLARRGASHIASVLVSLGGVDQNNVTEQVLRALAGSALAPTTQIAVVMGPTAPWLDAVTAYARQMPQRVEVLRNVSTMATLMRDADLAIGAAGSSSWERCCMGLPTVLLVLAQNQTDIALALGRHDAAVIADTDNLPEVLRALLARQDASVILSQMSQRASELTDGRGREHVLDVMCEIVP